MCISYTYCPSFSGDLTFSALGLRRLGDRPPKLVWLNWHPPDHGVMDDLAFVSKGGLNLGAAVLRDARGRFPMAVVMELPHSSPLDEVIFLVDRMCGNDPDVISSISAIRGSHVCMGWLAGSEASVPHDVLPTRRRTISRWSASFERISPIQNAAALAVVCTCSVGNYLASDSLSVHAQNALRADFLGLPSSCSFDHFRVASRQFTDDTSVGTSPVSLFHLISMTLRS